jgi:hypothetical protein
MEKKYKYGFSDKDTSAYQFDKGLSKDTIIKLSKLKKEPK